LHLVSDRYDQGISKELNFIAKSIRKK
jgi:hypothetical protein